MTVPSAQITNGITVTFIFLRSFSSLARSRYFSLFSPTLSFTIRHVFCFCWLSLGLVFWPRWGDPLVSQNSRAICASRSPGWILVWAIIISSHSQLNFFTQFQVDYISTQSCLFLHSFWLISCIHLLCDWSFLVYRRITYICYFVRSYLFLLW